MSAIPKPKRLRNGAAYARAPGQEAETARRLGGTPTVASGAFGDKGDVKAAAVRVECKATARKSFSVTREMLEKIADASAGHGQIPFVEIEFLNKTTGAVEAACAVCPRWAIDHLNIEGK